MGIKSALSALLIFAFIVIICGITSAQTPLTPDSPVIKLDEIGIYSVGYQYRGKPVQAFPNGWSGMFEEKTGISCLPSGTQNGKQMFLLHCPWRNGTGTTFQEFTFKIPAHVKRVTLRGFTAMLDDVVGKSDGAVFRIYINGRKLYETSQADSIWRPFKLDLNSYIGKVLNIRFETDPGPKDNPNFDYSLWGDRELVLEGFKPVRGSSTMLLPLQLSSMHTTDNESPVPLCGYKGSISTNLSGNTAVFKYTGPDGTLEYRWKRPAEDTKSSLGSIILSAKDKTGKVKSVPVATTASIWWAKDVVAGKSRWLKQGSDAITCIQPFTSGETSFEVKITGRMIGKSLVLDIECDNPSISMLDAGNWGPVMRRKQINIPYYTGQIFYLPAENLFVNAFLDWTSSSATVHDGCRAQYAPLTDGSRNTLKERIIYTASWHLAEVFPNIPNPPSPFIKQVGNRIVLDIWGGRYTDIAKKLETLHDYGITNCIAIIHAWQRSGYDNALPAHIPANESLGGDAGMKVLVDTARRLGYLISLHENYVDYYPNYDFYDENDIALDSEGNKQKAWYNEGTKIQSYAVKPNAIMRLAKTQSPEINRRYGTNADYLDVHSAVPPWFHIDQRSGEVGAGMFKRTWDVHKELWDFERKTHNGPVFGEGAAHWYWSGLLDGVEAQFRYGLPEKEGMNAPLMVDFDLQRIHPLQVNHGMGYYERWWKANTWGVQPPMVVLDQYRMQEVAYGHTGFLGNNTWDNISLAWLEHNLLTPVMERYAGVKPASVSYEIEGKWVDGTEAAKSESWQRVKTRYENGLTVTANNSKENMRVGTYELPQYGWLAEGAGVTAYTAVRDGAVVDYAETRDSVFANARNIDTWNASGIKRIRPELSKFEQVSPRTIGFTYTWHPNEAISSDNICFVHFCNSQLAPDGENIVFQQDHDLPKPTSTWKIGEVITDGMHTLELADNIKDGDYRWYIGMVGPQYGARLPLEGADDGHNRILLGILHVKENGAKITFTPEKSTGAERMALYNRNLNTQRKVIDFGTVRTNGSVMIRREGSDWVLQALPRDGRFTLELNAKRFPQPEVINSAENVSSIKPSPSQSGWWKLDLNGARQYRWSAN